MNCKHQIIIIGILLQFMCSCRNDCKDTISHKITEIEKEYFLNEYNDTIYYADKNTDSLYYLTRTLYKHNWDSAWSTDKGCGDYYFIFEEMDIELVSNFPHFQEYYAKIKIHLQTSGPSTSYIEVVFENNEIMNKDDYSDNQLWTFLYNNENNNFYTTDGLTLTSEFEYFESILINEKTYNNVYSICYREDDELNKEAFYDTIYLSRKGILKVISSQYGYYLERVE